MVLRHGLKVHLKRELRLLFLEDVITTGGSAIKAAKKLSDDGYEVERVVAIVDRQEMDKQMKSCYEELALDLELVVYI